jgi:hypothetical protein
LDISRNKTPVLCVELTEPALIAILEIQTQIKARALALGFLEPGPFAAPRKAQQS